MVGLIIYLIGYFFAFFRIKASMNSEGYGFDVKDIFQEGLGNKIILIVCLLSWILFGYGVYIYFKHNEKRFF